MSREVKPKYLILTILIAFVAMGISSCNRKEVYYKYSEIKEAKWSKYDTLTFRIDSSLIDPNTNYRVTIEIANSFNYPYRNIWLHVQDNFDTPDTESYQREYLLADEFGKWYGSGFGALYQMSLVYRELYRFESNNPNYKIKIVHGMRDQSLVGIEKIGVKIEKE